MGSHSTGLSLGWWLGGAGCGQHLDKTPPETHLRELVPLSQIVDGQRVFDADAQKVVWEFVRRTADDGKVTAAHVKSLVSVAKPLLSAGAINNGSAA